MLGIPQTSNINGGLEDISTIFVVGFPSDFLEREFQNMFTFSPGFEAATLKIPTDEEANMQGHGRKQIVSIFVIMYLVSLTFFFIFPLLSKGKWTCFSSGITLSKKKNNNNQSF